MKNYLVVIILIVNTLLSCNTSKKEEPPVLTGSKEFDLSEFGMPVTIQAPVNASVEQNMAGAIEIKAGKDFQLIIAEGSGNIELTKNDIKTNEVNKFKRFLVEEDAALFYESEVTKPEYHIFVVKKGENNLYELQDIKGEIFTEAAAKKMFDSAKTLKFK